MIALFLVLFIGYVILTAYNDVIVVETKTINHYTQALAFIFIALNIAITIFTKSFQFETERMYIEMFELFFCLCTIRWIVFDISFNLLSGNTVFYIGHTAWIDRHIRGEFQMIAKAICLYFTILFVAQWFVR